MHSLQVSLARPEAVSVLERATSKCGKVQPPCSQCGVITGRQPGANRPISLPCKIIAGNKVLVDVCINLPATQHVRQASADAAASVMGLAEMLKPNGAEVVEANRSESKMPRGGLRRRRGPASRKA